jgi:hypothetical protein
MDGEPEKMGSITQYFIVKYAPISVANKCTNLHAGLWIQNKITQFYSDISIGLAP